MPFASLKLRPGVNVEATPALNEAGISACNLIRFKAGLPQKLGGWTRLNAAAAAGVPRALHAWRDLNEVDRLAVGTTTRLGVMTSGVIRDITPQQITTNPTLAFTTTSGSTAVTVADSGIANVTTYDAVFLNTPVAVGGLVLHGVLPISSVLGTTSYQITAPNAATATRTTGNVTVTITVASPAVVSWSSHGLTAGQPVYFTTTGALPTGLTANTTYYVIAAGLGTNSFQVSASPDGAAVNTSGTQSGTHTGYAKGGEVPSFTTTSGSASVTVKLTAHGRSANDRFTFPIATTVGGVTISGTYTVQRVSNANEFVISVDAPASSSATASMNSGAAQVVYYISLGPAAAGTGFGLGGFGLGGFGTGVVPNAQTGTPIAADNWSHDNWGEFLVSVPKGGGVYYWAPARGYATAFFVPTAPVFNGGAFVAMPAQILVCWGSTVAAPGTTTTTNMPEARDPLIVRWSDQEDFTNFVVTSTTQSGSYRIPSGSEIIGAMQGPQQGLIWTDIDLWAMQYVGYPLVFSFNKLAGGCGLIAQHAAAVMRGTVAWMGIGGFFMLSGRGVAQIECPVWDAVYQDLDTANQHKITSGANSTFSEFWWFYPSLSGGTGECDKYVKVNMAEAGQPWDYGSLPRSAWIDQSVLGQPIGASPTGVVYQHETSPDADGLPLNAWYETGWFAIAEGQSFALMDMLHPDMKWGLFNGAQTGVLAVTIYAATYPNEPPRTYGPYAMAAAQTFINTRVRGRLIKLRIESADTGSTWRQGNPRYRFGVDGRR